MEAVLVTGGAGYIGAHICKRLAAADVLPVTLDDLSTGHEASVRWGPLFKGDIADVRLLKAVRHKHKPMAVIHAAALSDVTQSMLEPARCWHVNSAGTFRLRTVFGDLPWVLSSTAAVYGDGGELPLEEDSRTAPLSVYGSSKVEAEGMVRTGMRLRYFNVAGADDDIGLGHKPETQLIPRVLRAALTGGVLTVYGTGEAVRDFVHVGDVADANVLALRALLDGEPGQAINVCTGEGHSVTDVIRLATRVTRRRIAVTHDAPRPGDGLCVVGQNARALAVLGWSPKRDLIEQLVSSWQLINRPALAVAS